jgi:hypothetical protein
MTSALKNNQTIIPRQLWGFRDLSEEQLLKISPLEVSTLKNTSEEFHMQLSGNPNFNAFMASINNSLAFFGSAGLAFEKMVEFQNKLPTTPWVNKKFRHNQMGKIKQDFENHRAYAKLFSDYQTVKEDFEGQVGMAQRFLLQAQKKLREC